MDAPCAICGSKDLKLVDGFYYCIECGTQDTNVRETVVEQTMLADGTMHLGTTRKIQTQQDEGITMSGEWYKWHAFNFILMGLVEEMLSLGAKSTFKMKVLWIWTRYIKQFQNGNELGALSSFLDLEENPVNKLNDDNDSNDDLSKEKKASKARKSNGKIQNITTNLLLSILYVALNLDKSDIQLSHLFRYVREGRLSLLNWAKFIPNDIKVKRIPEWIRFERCNKECSRLLIHKNSASLFKVLKLGAPIVPDLNKLVENYVRELCLPNDFRHLVLSLMNLIPCDFLIFSNNDVKDLKKMPDYEVTIMGFILVAVKMCFGLDDDYELKLSDAVDFVNESEYDHLKSYKLGVYSSTTDRLFSFRDWSQYLQLRKIILSRFYLPMAWQNNTEADDYILLEQMDNRSKGKSKISDEITMDILNKIPHDEEGAVIPKSEFLPSLIPMTTYIGVILQYFQDPELKLILSEDFTQYSLSYAIDHLAFPSKFDNLKDIVTGVSEDNKIKNKNIVGTLVSKTSNFTEVYVRNCENKNWLKTNPPTTDHVEEDTNESDKEIDHGYDSPPDESVKLIENISEDLDSAHQDTHEEKDDVKLEYITEEVEEKNIFDDTFENIKEEKTEITINDTILDFDGNEPNESVHNFDNDNAIHDSKSDVFSCASRKREFDPNSFNRANTIKELILQACKELKAPIPREYSQREPRKRQRDKSLISDSATAPKRKKINTKPGEAKREVEKIISIYYSRAENQLLNQISEPLVNTYENSLSGVNQQNMDSILQPESNNVSDIVDNENNTIQNVETNSTSIVDPSLIMQSSDAEEEVELSPKVDPKYDENTHDIKQLYVKINEKQDINLDDILNFEDDPEFIKIIEQKIDQFSNGNLDNGQPEPQKTKTIDDSDSDSESEVPLKILQQEKQILEQKKISLEPLVKRDDRIEYNYWLRHYTTDSFRKNQRMNTKFDKELLENFPNSFVFVIKECASILNCQTFVLYKIMQNLEQVLLTKVA